MKHLLIGSCILLATTSVKAGVGQGNPRQTSINSLSNNYIVMSPSPTSLDTQEDSDRYTFAFNGFSLEIDRIPPSQANCVPGDEQKHVCTAYGSLMDEGRVVFADGEAFVIIVRGLSIHDEELKDAFDQIISSFDVGILFRSSINR